MRRHAGQLEHPLHGRRSRHEADLEAVALGFGLEGVDSAQKRAELMARFLGQAL